MTIKLFGGPKTRASMPRWYLEEKQIAYELVELDLRVNQHRQPGFLAIKPFGKLPVLMDSSVLSPNGESLTLFESGAILLHLAEHYTNDIRTAAEKALTSQWLLFANATLSIALFVPSSREREFPRLMAVLDQQLDPDRPLVGHCWGAADCAVQAHLTYLPLFYPEMDLSAYPAIQEVIRRTHARPAYRQVMGMG